MTSLPARLWRRALSPVRDDSGFTLLESVIALMVATIAFTALAAGAMSAIRGTLTGRQNQQAADFMGREIEALRLVDFDSLAHVPSDLAGDPAVANCGANKCFDPGTGPERLVTDAGGAVSDHVEEPLVGEANRTRFSVSSYVTAPNWSQVDYFKRVTVVVSWQDGSVRRTRSDSTIVARNQRGLPLPVFRLTPVGSTSISVNPGATVVFGLTVNNQGAPDRFNLIETDLETWSWFRDTDGNGAYDSGVDTTAVTDTNSDGVIDTGKMDPNGTVTIWLVRTVPGAAPASSTNTTVMATSVGQPLAEGAVKTLPFVTNVVIGTITASPTPTPSGTSSATPTPSPSPSTDCSAASSATGSASSGYTLRSYTLHNVATPANSDAQTSLTMAVTAPYATMLYEYSQNVLAGQPGRVLNPGGVAFPGGSTDPAKVADWRFPVGQKAYDGTAAVNLWVSAPVGSTLSSVSLTADVYKYTKQGNTYTATSVKTIPLTIGSFTCSGFQQVGGTGSIAVPKLGNNDWLGLRVVNSGAAATRIAYDVLSVYPAALVLPEK